MERVRGTAITTRQTDPTVIKQTYHNRSSNLLQRRHHCLVIGLPNIKRNLANQSLDSRLLLIQARATSCAAAPLLDGTNRLLILGITKNVVSGLEDVVWITGGVSRTRNTDGLEDSAAAQLVDDHLRIEAVGDKFVIWFEAANVVWYRRVDARAELG